MRNGSASAQSSLLLNHFNINLDRLHKLALPFPDPSQPGAGIANTSHSKGKEKTPFVKKDAYTRDITQELQNAGYDFLVIDEDGFVNTQHNSTRDFILAEED